MLQTADPMSKAHDYMRGEDSLYSGLKKGTLMNKGKLKSKFNYKQGPFASIS